MATTEKRRKSFNKWYEANKERFNEERKKKYHSDPAVREKYIERQKAYRKNAPHVDKPQTKLVNGVEVEVFRIGYAASFVGRSEDVIRRWEKEQIIPKPSIEGGKHRYYTKTQLVLMKELSEVLDVLKDNREAMELAIVKKSGEIHLLWEK